MILTRHSDALTVSCPAKLNLFLETHGLRHDGYHEIETVMQAITLYDQLRLARPPDEAARPLGTSNSGTGILPVSTTGQDHGQDARATPEPVSAHERLIFRCTDPALDNGQNLASRAASLLLDMTGHPGGVVVTLDKSIPYGTGLGGASSDAAGVLVGLNQLLQLGLSTAQLTPLAAQLGSDVPFFLHGGTALCTGRGEQVTPIHTQLVAHYVICCPPAPLSTATVYKNLAGFGLTSGDRDATFMTQALVRGDLSAVRSGLFNRLGRAAAQLAPDVARTQEILAEVSHRPAVVSGSGSAVYALLDTAGEAAEVAREVGTRMAGQVFAAETEPAQPSLC